MCWRIGRVSSFLAGLSLWVPTCGHLYFKRTLLKRVATCILNDPHRNALPVFLLRQVYVVVFFRVFLAPFFLSFLAGLMSPLSAPLGANMVRFGGQLGSQNGAEIEVFGRPRGYLS